MLSTTYAGKSWAGANVEPRFGRERSLAQKHSSWWPDDEDAQMFANLQAQAWREDPRPLAQIIQYSREERVDD